MPKKKVERLTKDEKKIFELRHKWELLKCDYNREHRRAEEYKDLLKIATLEQKTYLRLIDSSVEEIRWLRSTLRLVVTPMGREDELAKLIQEDEDPARMGYRRDQF